MDLTRFDDYEAYKAAQLAATAEKLDAVYVTAGEMNVVADLILTHVPVPHFGICHGVRTGFEVCRLRDRLPFAHVTGTDLSPAAAEAYGMLCWDFHNVKPEWVDQCDFIYSNSFDHTYDPHLCLKNWFSCLSPQGLLILHWGHDHGPQKQKPLYKADCFRAGLDEYKALLKQHGVYFTTVILPDVYGKNRKTGNHKRRYPRRLIIGRRGN